MRSCLAPCSSAWASQRWATAGTTAVMVTPSCSIVANTVCGCGEASMTTRPPDSRAPRMPGQASGKLCEAGRVARYTVPSPRPHSAAEARAL